MRVDTLADSDCGSEPVSYVTIKVDCTSGLVVEVFNYLDQVGVDVIKPHSRPKGFMPYSVKRLFKINKGGRDRCLVDVEGTSRTVS